jgi:hypothetical protein
MAKRITLIQGHPDLNEAHLCHVLVEVYAMGAEQPGHEVRPGAAKAARLLASMERMSAKVR